MKAKKKYAERFVGITPKEYEKLEDRHKKVLEIFSQTNLSLEKKALQESTLRVQINC